MWSAPHFSYTLKIQFFASQSTLSEVLGTQQPTEFCALLVASMKEEQQVCSLPHAHGPFTCILGLQQQLLSLFAQFITSHSNRVIFSTPLKLMRVLCAV